MLAETLYIVCGGCGHWTWDVRVFDFPVLQVVNNRLLDGWKKMHAACGGRRKRKMFSFLSENDERIFDLDPTHFDLLEEAGAESERADGTGAGGVED